MAKKNSSGVLGIVVIILLAVIIAYWKTILFIAIPVLVVWGIVKLVQNSSSSASKSKPATIIASSHNSNSKGPSISQVKSSVHAPPITLTVTTSQQTSSPSYRNDATIQPQSASPEGIWIPCGRTFQHAGFSISGGLVYFGKGLKSVQRWSEEPSLIDPSLPVDKSNPDHEGRNMGYWPSYSQIHPTSRAAFLEWLAEGKKNPRAYIGYVFIYFYGLERRALADTKDSSAAGPVKNFV